MQLPFRKKVQAVDDCGPAGWEEAVGSCEKAHSEPLKQLPVRKNLTASETKFTQSAKGALKIENMKTEIVGNKPISNHDSLDDLEPKFFPNFVNMNKK